MSWCSDENANCRASGDQNGLVAPSVPGKCRHSRALKSRIQSPPFLDAAKTSLRPSGDTDKNCSEVTFSGSTAWNRLTWVDGCVLNQSIQTARPTARKAKTAAKACHGRMLAAGTVVKGVSAAIESSACFTSRADCQRLSGSFSRQVSMTRSSAGGIPDWSLCKGGGDSL